MFCESFRDFSISFANVLLATLFAGDTVHDVAGGAGHSSINSVLFASGSALDLWARGYIWAGYTINSGTLPHARSISTACAIESQRNLGFNQLISE